jgi:hypothetical protein
MAKLCVYAHFPKDLPSSHGYKANGGEVRDGDVGNCDANIVNMIS